ncbi:citrate synthase [soil metagenome]
MTERMPRLTSAQTASRLGVKVESLYAYVSRGLLVSTRAEDGGSTFDPLAVEELAERRRRGAPRGSGGRMSGRPIMVLDSALALIDGDELYLRGISVRELAHTHTFEQAVRFLWRDGAAPTIPDDTEQAGERFTSTRETVTAIRRAERALGTRRRLIDQLVLAVTIAASMESGRTVLDAASVQDAGRRMMATMVDSLIDQGAAAPRTAPLAERLWPKLSARTPSSGELRLLDSAMVLGIEHDLAISTMAARVAASARADPYLAITAALSAFDGASHGAASVKAVELVEETIRTGNAEHALARSIAATGVIPGFGHVLYRREDPRARFLLDAMGRLPTFREAVRAADTLSSVVALRAPRPVNLDLALATFVVGAGLRREAGELVFAVSRTAGWVAHIIDEYAQPALRLRPESRYTGPATA